MHLIKSSFLKLKISEIFRSRKFNLTAFVHKTDDGLILVVVFDLILVFTSNKTQLYYLRFAYPISLASLVESGRSCPLVSGSRKTKTPASTARLLKTTVGIERWYTANMLSSGDSNPAILKAAEPRPTAVCLNKQRK